MSPRISPARQAYLAIAVMLFTAFWQSFILSHNLSVVRRELDLDITMAELLLPTGLRCAPFALLLLLWTTGRCQTIVRGLNFGVVLAATLGTSMLIRIAEVFLFDVESPLRTGEMTFLAVLPVSAGWQAFQEAPMMADLEAKLSALTGDRLRTLRAQLQPHFLFNTLHAIGVTAKQDPDAAQRMTTLLGDLLRAALVDRGGKLVSVSEELSLLQPYVQLQQVRFQDRLRLETDVPPRLLSAQVPDLLLQPLVENAIEHGIEQRPGAGLVRIVVRTEDGKLVVEVEDDGPGPAQEGEPKDVGVGLGATIQRIRLLFAAEAWLELRRNRHGGTTTQVKLPLEYVKAAG